jgi:two-component system, HptB-dependent secretion and biofilm response regulator
MTTPLRILVADDNQGDRLLLLAILRKEGHEVIAAVDGVHALEQFDQHAPQLVLLDAMMPRMDGLEVARRIKARSGDRFVPILFLTSLTEASDLAACLDAGGDDFLSKPYNRIILGAKIAAFDRMRQLHVAVQEKRDELKRHHRRMLQEQSMAKAIFDRVAHAGCLDASNIRYLISPMAVFNGDVLLAARTPAGNMHVFLGDFTGHGLPASIGAMPLAELFYSMTAKGFLMADILREANRKLCDILPTGFFCCAAMANLDFHKGTAEVWNGGLPAVYLVRQGNQIEHLPSMHLPLGLLSPRRFRGATVMKEMAIGERVVMCTDGVLEARNNDGEMFGAARLTEILMRRASVDSDIAEIRTRLAEHVSGQARQDDCSLVEVSMVAVDAMAPSRRRPTISNSRGPRNWRLDYRLEGPSLAAFYPLPLLHQILMEVPELRSRGGAIFAVLSELYSNALDHGVMGLDSLVKGSPDGFDDYYRGRSHALAGLDYGWIRFRIRSIASGSDGSLIVRVIDSGSGFDWRRFTAVQSAHGTQLHGRGLRLVSELCDSVRFRGCGNDVEVVFRWSGPAGGARRGVADRAALVDGG